MNTNDTNKNWENDSKDGFLKTGVLELPYTLAPNGECQGHAMVIVGYDDGGYGGKYGGGEGAFMVRNSWGTTFGAGGYWYLPYSLVDDAANQPRGQTFPFSYDEHFVYISAMSHD